MEKLKCIVVEDEPLAAEILEDYIKQVPFLEMHNTYADAFYALDALRREEIDVMFLDIHLPKLKGFDFLRTIKNPPQTIITTAYRDYALESYELNVVDYLLKPVSISRFLKAVNKLEREKNDVNQSIPKKSDIEQAYLFININKKKVKIQLDEVLFVESRKDYINIVTEHDNFLTKMQIGEITALLDGGKFLRVHRSFIVAIEKVSAFSASRIEIKEHIIPVGRTYKIDVLEKQNDKFV